MTTLNAVPAGSNSPLEPAGPTTGSLLPEMFRVLPETPADTDEVEFLLDLAFAPGRTALSSYQLREGVPSLAALSTIVRDEFDSVVAAIRYWPVRIGGAGWPSLLLGPVAVHPTRQGEGLGAILIMETLEKAKTQGWERVILVGDEPYYRRFGFTRDLTRALDFPKPVNLERLLAKELVEGSFSKISGMVRRWSDDERE